MSDDRLIHGLRALDRPVEVDPGFADSLYSVLELERARRRRGRPDMVLLVAAVLLMTMLLGATLAVGSGLIDLPWQVREDRDSSLHAILPSRTAAWSRADLPRGAGVNSITAVDGRLFAVGTAGEEAAMWTSEDGRIWTQVLARFGPGSIDDLVVGGPGLIATGTADASPNAPDGANGGVWISADGATWNRVSNEPVFHRAWISDVIAGGPGLVAVGTVPDGLQVWFSRDGTSWEAADVPAMPADTVLDTGMEEPRAYAYFGRVAAIGDRLVATGIVGVGGYEGATIETSGVFEELVIWTSSDGESWTELPLDPAVFPRGSTISDLASGPRGLVAVGWHRQVGAVDEQPAVWISADGVEWRLAPTDQEAFISRLPNGFAWGGLRSVAAGGAGYVAVGGEGQCAGGSCPSAETAVWTSADGLSWLRVPPGPVFQMGPDDIERDGWVSASGVTTWGSRFVGWGENDDASAVWVSD